ncbi:MAG: 7-cyano-7-deazaguanine synthase QueC, partial [Pseudomonadota bacterium]
MKKAIVIYSGGMDSYTVLHKAIQSNDVVHAISFDYGQRHKKELEYASAVCGSLNLEHHVVNLAAINPLLAGSALTDNIEVPEGHYEEASMQQTVVPNRNMIMLSIAVGYAVSVEAQSVYFGAHSGDHAIYPDCRTAFVDAMNSVCAIANYQAVEIRAPYLHKNKI